MLIEYCTTIEFNIIKATPTKAQAQSSTCLGLHNSVGP